MTTKRPWKSRTQIVNFVSIIGALALAFGFDISPEQQAAIVTVVLLIVNVINMYLRTVSPKAITFKASEDPVETDPPTGV